MEETTKLNSANRDLRINKARYMTKQYGKMIELKIKHKQ